MDIINFGSLHLDHVYRVGKFVRPGETMAAAGYSVFSGGKGLNQSVAAARAGGRVLHAGAVGPEGQPLIDVMKNSGVDVSLLLQTDQPQGHAIIQVNDAGENCILLFRGSNFSVSKEYIDHVFSQLTAPAYIILQNEISNPDYIVERAYSLGFSVILNASPIDEGILKLDLNQVTWLMINEIEGEQITGQRDYNRILDVLAEKYPALSVVLTLGGDGSLCSCQGKRLAQKIYRVEIVDSTAAGDTFTGYFVASLAQGLAVEKALDRSARAAALAVSRRGAAPSIPTADEVDGGAPGPQAH